MVITSHQRLAGLLLGENAVLVQDCKNSQEMEIKISIYVKCAHDSLFTHYSFMQS